MNAGASAAEVYRDSVDRIRGHDLPSPIESLRRETFALLEAVRPVSSTDEVDAALGPLRSVLERPLAVALALLDYGGERGRLEAGWMLQVLATELGETEAKPTEPMLALALHDLPFSLLADCLSRTRLEPLPRLGAVAIPGRFERQSWPIFQAAAVRHLSAFERSADLAYTSWAQWLVTSELTTALTHVRNSRAFEAVATEAELIGALAFAERHGERSFCAIVGAEGPAERRLRQHLRDSHAAAAIAELLGVGEAELDETLNRLYANLTGPGPFGSSHGQLIAPD